MKYILWQERGVGSGKWRRFAICRSRKEAERKHFSQAFITPYATSFKITRPKQAKGEKK